MRIAYLLTSLAMGGAERLTLELGDAMRSRGHAVCVLVLRAQEPEEWPTELEVVHLNLRKNLLSLPQALWRARRALREFQPELVHSHTSFANLFARLLRLLYPAPVLSTVHNLYEGGKLRMLAYRLTDPLCRLTTAVCTAAAERYVKLRAVPASKCRVVTNGIDQAAFTSDGERRNRMRGELGVGEEFLWLAAGRVSPAKDYPNLLRAFALVRAAHPDAQLCIAGGIATSVALEKAARPELEAAGVRWLGLRRDMAALLDAADGYVLSSAWEGMPLVIAEAMAMEKPVVATDVGGVRELMGETGQVVIAGDSARLAEAMLATMKLGSEIRAEQGIAARRRIEEYFSLTAKASEWEGIYRGLVEN